MGMLSNTKKIKFLVFFYILVQFVYGLVPVDYKINLSDGSNVRLIVDDLASDAVVDLRLGLNSRIYAGTSGGVSFVDYSNLNIDFFHFEDSNLPNGGNPSIITEDLGNGEDMIVVSGIVNCGTEVCGSGIAWSLDSGNTWSYTEQPTDQIPDCESITNPSICSPASTGCSYNPTNNPVCTYQGSVIPFNWNGSTLYSNPITVTERNISYDISIDVNNGYIYIASWAGMLRRLKFTDQNPSWNLVPLPVDINPDSGLTFETTSCGGYGNSYIYNPVDPIWGSSTSNSGGNHNHKAYSVHVDGGTIWVGTANGVNKGIINGNCIDWTHYTTTDGLSGNWVIDVVPQDIGSTNRIWLISWDLVSPVTPHGLTYTDDYGATWNIVNQFNNPEDGGSDSAIVYNLFFDNIEMYSATDKGLYYSTLGNEQSWSSYPIPEDCFEDTEKVYTYIKEGNLEFVGTPNGLIYTCSVNQCGNGWCNEEYVEDNIHSDLGVYPNPASNYTNFIFPVTNLRSNLTGSVDVFNFAMEQVKSNVSCFNDGENLKCDYDNINLSNGVYFCRLTYGNKEVWGKLMIIN